MAETVDPGSNPYATDTGWGFDPDNWTASELMDTIEASRTATVTGDTDPGHGNILARGKWVKQNSDLLPDDRVFTASIEYDAMGEAYNPAKFSWLAREIGVPGHVAAAGDSGGSIGGQDDSLSGSVDKGSDSDDLLLIGVGVVGLIALYWVVS